ncbi:hypothetical protein [Sphingomonas bacterium]|uniref:hypothetical protein n=1 Tax=Sphingomonas bacterium TaxID=1895847 RepID=UPI0015768FCB|nr:hypothetical protein [Sphingomonas bacterium]
MIADVATREQGRGDLSIGRVLARASEVIAAAPLLFLGISLATAALPQALLRFVVPPDEWTIRHAFAELLLVAVVALIAWAALHYGAQALLLRVSVARLDGGREPLVVSVAGAAAVVAPMLAMMLVFAMAALAGTMLLIVPGIMLVVMWSVAAPVLVIERPGILAALARSRALTRGHRWRVFGLLLLVYGTYWMAGVGLGVGTGLAVAGGAGTGSLITTGVTIVLATGFMAISTAIQAALYVELRDGHDGPAGYRLRAIFA